MDSYWLIPALCIISSGLLAYGLIQVDRNLARRGTTLAFTGEPDSARSLLSTFAQSTVTLAALVFSITVLILQLASSQFSPRALRTFMRDRHSQFALGIFLGTFSYAVIVLREVRGEDGIADRFVPGITINVAFALMIASIGMFVSYINRVAHSIRVSTIIDSIGDETRDAIDKSHGEDQRHQDQALMPDFPGPAALVGTDGPGTVRSVETANLLELAEEADGYIKVLPRMGEFVATGMPLMEVWSRKELDEKKLRSAVSLVKERGSGRDVSYGLRQLVDIAERALSPGTNDPSTAVECVNQLHDLLRRLVARSYPSQVHRDSNDEMRVFVPSDSWDDHVALAFDELRLWGGESLQIRRRLQWMLQDLLEVAEGDRRTPLLKRLPLWKEPLQGVDAEA